jgi:hypothetical protein
LTDFGKKLVKLEAIPNFTGYKNKKLLISLDFHCKFLIFPSKFANKESGRTAGG